MDSVQQSVIVAFAGFTAEIHDHGDRREITIARERASAEWLYHETTLASLAACVERFARSA